MQLRFERKRVADVGTRLELTAQEDGSVLVEVGFFGHQHRPMMFKTWLWPAECSDEDLGLVVCAFYEAWLAGNARSAVMAATRLANAAGARW
jgi:hypothetical protein